MKEKLNFVFGTWQDFSKFWSKPRQETGWEKTTFAAVFALIVLVGGPAPPPPGGGGEGGFLLLG
jgi:hypothetical protein